MKESAIKLEGYDRSVGAMVAERPSRSKVFRRFQIDFCCGGGLSLREASVKAGVLIEQVMEALALEGVEENGEVFNPASLAPQELVPYIVEKHHAFLKIELPRLLELADRVARVHGGTKASLLEVFHEVGELSRELTVHMRKEEEELFPKIVAWTKGSARFSPSQDDISVLVLEHDEAGAGLKRLSALTHGYQIPEDACGSYRALISGLEGLEKDLHAHVHLENSVLFPSVLKIARLEV